jgi:NitT/TauT family transport system substrate-binding protein
MKRWIWLTAAALLIALSGCAKRDEAGLKKVRFTEVIHSLYYTPQYVAEAKGYFRAEGIQLEMSTAQGSDKGVAALLAGTADIALVGPETTIYIQNQESPQKVKLVAQLTTGDGSFLVARRPSPQFTWSELKGKSIIGWRVGSMPQLVADAVLRQQGLTPGTDVQYISNVSAPAMAAAFEGGQGDYLQVFEPIPSQLEEAGKGYVVASFREAYGPLPYTGYVATDRYIAEHPEVIRGYVRAVHRAVQYVEETDPAVVAKEIAPFFEGTDQELIAAAIRRYRAQGSWQRDLRMEPAGLARLQDLMVAGGVLDPGRRVTFEAVATNQFVDGAAKGAR